MTIEDIQKAVKDLAQKVPIAPQDVRVYPWVALRGKDEYVILVEDGIRVSPEMFELAQSDFDAFIKRTVTVFDATRNPLTEVKGPLEVRYYQ